MASIFSISTSALRANLAALHATSHNIANAHTPGYSRQQVELGSGGAQGTGSGFFGSGVNVLTVSRGYNQFLTRQANVAHAQASADAARLSQLEVLEGVFPLGANGMGQAAGALLNAFADVATDPQDLSARQVLIGRAQELAGRFKNAAVQIDEMQAGVTADVRNTVKTVNELASQVATLNGEISRALGHGHQPNDLLDKRDHLIAEINKHVEVSTVAADDGSINLFIGGSQNLVLGINASKLAAVPDEFDHRRVQLAIQDRGGTRTLPGSLITGGSLAGLMRFQNEDLSTARNLLGQMAAAFSDSLNQQQALGLDLNQAAGGPLFATGEARVLASNLNSGNAQVTIDIADASKLKASDYELSEDRANPGNYLLKRLSDGVVTDSISAADLAAGHTTADGFTLQMTGTPGPADRFLVQPVAMAAGDMRTVLSDPRGIAAASPFTASVGDANTGSVNVRSVAMVDAGAADPTLTARITFTDDQGNYDWELVDGNNAVVSSGSDSWTAGQPIAHNGFELQLDGVPKAGDALQVEPTQFPASNNGNALAMLDLRDAGMVDGQSITNAYSEAMANIGVRTQSARISADISGALATEAETRRANNSGVDLDEEAARLIQFQQSYQASAKVLQVAQSLFDSLLQSL